MSPDSLDYSLASEDEERGAVENAEEEEEEEVQDDDDDDGAAQGSPLRADFSNPQVAFSPQRRRADGQDDLLQEQNMPTTPTNQGIRRDEFEALSARVDRRRDEFEALSARVERHDRLALETREDMARMVLRQDGLEVDLRSVKEAMERGGMTAVVELVVPNLSHLLPVWLANKGRTCLPCLDVHLNPNEAANRCHRHINKPDLPNATQEQIEYTIALLAAEANAD